MEMELQKHIEILLLSNDCVIVPGLGGFTASHVAAKWDEHDGVFLPPIRTLGFNARLDANDFLLAQSYCEAYDISYPEALTRIQDETSELRARLSEDGLYELYGIGVLRLNAEGNIEFTPTEAGILTPKLYGLSSFEMNAIRPRQTIEKEKAPTVSFPTLPLQGSKVPFEKAMLSVKDEEKQASQEMVIRIKYSVLKKACIGVVSIALLLAIILPVSNSDTLRTSNFDGGIIRSISNNIEKVKTNKETLEDNQNASLGAELGAIKEIYKEYFCLVLASRLPQENAEAFVEQLSLSGLKAYAINENNSYKVIYGRYATKDEAFSSLSKLKSNKYFNEAWVYQVRN